MSDQSASTLVIPADIQEKFGDLILLIRQSESMNDEERQYWINILPIMTPEQIQNLQDILMNEKQQLAAIDAKYAQQTDAAPASPAETEEERRRKRDERRRQERSALEREEQHTESILNEIESA